MFGFKTDFRTLLRFLRKIKNNYIGSEFPHKIKHLHTSNLSHFRNPPIFSETHFLTTHIYSDKRAEYSTRYPTNLLLMLFRPFEIFDFF